MILRENIIDTAFRELKVYFSNLKINNIPIAFKVKEKTTEFDTSSYPLLFTEVFRLVPDGNRSIGDTKYQYQANEELDITEGKLRSKPYLISFNLELLDTQTINFYKLRELIDGQQDRNGIIPLFEEDCPITIGTSFEINSKGLNHCFWPVSIEISLDSSLELFEAETITDINLNGETL